MRGFVEMAEYDRVCRELENVRAERDTFRADLGQEVDLALVATVRLALRLSPTEGLILAALYQSKTRFLTKEGLLAAAAPDSELKTLDVWVCRIRAKIGHRAIETVRGSGYRLSATGSGLIECAVTLGGLTPVARLRAKCGEGR